MSIFSSIKNAIFGGPAVAAPSASAPAPSAAPSAPASSPTAAPAPSSAPAASKPAAATPAAAVVDVTPILDQAVAKSGQKLDWRHSIVDLMKVLDLDSGVQARKQLAQELHYTGDTKDSAKMNVWLHKQVMTKLAENGGKVPEDLKH